MIARKIKQKIAELILRFCRYLRQTTARKIRIIDSKNNVLGSKNTQKFGNETLNYSASKKVKYQSKTLKIECEIPVTDLKDGILFINIFDESKLILNSAVTLS